jgi:DNA-binding MarR family transcriptional regulator
LAESYCLDRHHLYRRGEYDAQRTIEKLASFRPKQTKLIDALEKDSCVTREPIAGDRSAINRVTPAGLSYIVECLKDIRIANEVLRSCLDQSEIETFFTLTRKVRRRLIQEVGNEKREGAKREESQSSSKKLSRTKWCLNVSFFLKIRKTEKQGAFCGPKQLFPGTSPASSALKCHHLVVHYRRS